MPLRQALLRLQVDGLIELQPHRSAIVTPLSASQIEEIYAMRTALEPMLAEVGATRCGADELAAMAELLELIRTAVAAGQMQNFVELDRRFHRELYRASRYPQACELMERLRDASDRYVYFYAMHGTGAHQSLKEHEQILDACRNKQVGRVRRLTEEHIKRGAAVLTKLVADGESARTQLFDRPGHDDSPGDRRRLA
jgi:DNA-binding GntR family transcriptional regulator